MKRLETLEARRRALLARCDQQRIEIAYHIAKLGPRTQIARWTNRAPQSGRGSSLAWLAGAVSLIVMLRPRRLLSWLTWITGTLSLVSRAARVIRLIAHLRALRSGSR